MHNRRSCCVHTSAQTFFPTEPGALTLPREKCHSGVAPDSTRKPPASCRAGTWAGGRPRPQAGRPRGATGAPSLGDGSTGRGDRHQRRDPAGCRLRAGDPAFPRVGCASAKTSSAVGATHPVQVEALGAARGLLGAGAQAHGHGQLGHSSQPRRLRGGPTSSLSADSPFPALDHRSCHVGAWPRPIPNSDALRDQPAAPFPRTRRPPTSGRERRTQDPDFRESDSRPHHETLTLEPRASRQSSNDSSRRA